MEQLFEDFKTAKIKFIQQGIKPENVDLCFSMFKKLKDRNGLSDGENDIDYWAKHKTFSELFNFVIKKTQSIEKSKNIKTDDSESIVLLNSKEFKVILPLTEKASVKFGINTKWCTSAKSDCRFDIYFGLEQTPLIYVLVKSTGERFAIRFNIFDGKIEELKNADQSKNYERNPKTFYKQVGVNPVEFVDKAMAYKTLILEYMEISLKRAFDYSKINDYMIGDVIHTVASYRTDEYFKSMVYDYFLNDSDIIRKCLLVAPFKNDNNSTDTIKSMSKRDYAFESAINNELENGNFKPDFPEDYAKILVNYTAIFIKKPWKQIHSFIYDFPSAVYNYAVQVLKGRFVSAEKTFFSNNLGYNKVFKEDYINVFFEQLIKDHNFFIYALKNNYLSYVLIKCILKNKENLKMVSDDKFKILLENKEFKMRLIFSIENGYIDVSGSFENIAKLITDYELKTKVASSYISANSVYITYFLKHTDYFVKEKKEKVASLVLENPSFDFVNGLMKLGRHDVFLYILDLRGYQFDIIYINVCELVLAYLLEDKLITIDDVSKSKKLTRIVLSTAEFFEEFKRISDPVSFEKFLIKNGVNK